ncbi:MAG TPA: hypothetical protein VF848_07760 [Steroidobacteraceae bacterium]
MYFRVCCLLTTAAIAAAVARGQEQAPPVAAASAPSDATPASTARQLVLHSGTRIPLRFLQALSSATDKSGTQFRLEVTDDIQVDDLIAIPAGSPAIGEIVDARPAGMLGKPGILIVAARYVLVGDRQIRLKSNLGSTGRDTSSAAIFVPFIRGKQAEIPEQTEVLAKVANDETFVAPAISVGEQK